MFPPPTTADHPEGSHSSPTRLRGIESPAHQGRGSAERVTRRFLLVAALILSLFAALALLAPLLVTVPSGASGAISWRPTAIGAAVILGLLCWKLPGALITLTFATLAFEAPPLFAEPPSLATLATFSQTLLIGLLLSFSGTVVLRLSHSADSASAARTHATAAAAAAAGAIAAGAKAAALVHDEVLSTLNLASQPHLVSTGDLAAQATRARTLLLNASSEETPGTTVASLREDALTLDPGVSLHVTTPETGDSLRLPPTVLAVIRSALRQALRNSLLHAGDSAKRRVLVTLTADSLELEIADDGVGFNPEQVSVKRLGLRTTAQAVRSIGGEITVRSAIGTGTRVRVVWNSSAPHAEPATHAYTPTLEGINPALQPRRRVTARESVVDAARLSDAPTVQVGVAVTTAAFAVTQAMLAAVAISNAEPWWAPVLLTTLLFVSAYVLQHRFGSPLTGARTALVLTFLILTAGIGLLCLPFAVGDLWFAGGAGFLLAAVAFRGRPVAAATTGLLISAMLGVSGFLAGAPMILIAAVSVRPLGVVSVAVALAFSVTALLRRIHRDFTVTEAESARESWQQGAQAELAARATEVRGLVDQLLSEIARGEALPPHTRARAAATEGHLRDRIRAGRLAREPLLSAVMRARERGVDVVLLDDLDGPLPTHVDMEGTVSRLASLCEGAKERITVRMLPASRAASISLVIDGNPVPLP